MLASRDQIAGRGFLGSCFGHRHLLSVLTSKLRCENRGGGVEKQNLSTTAVFSVFP